MRIDHVIYATRDLDEAAARIEAELGVRVVVGGRHEGLGTHNRIAPLGDGYLELLAVCDEQEAARSAIGSAVTARITELGDGLMGWAVEVDDVRPVTKSCSIGVVSRTDAGWRDEQEATCLARLQDTTWSLVLIYPTITIPVSVWLLTGFLKAIPRDVEEQAMIDGRSHAGACLRVVVPLALPGIVAVIVFAFTLTAHEFIHALALISPSPRCAHRPPSSASTRRWRYRRRSPRAPGALRMVLMPLAATARRVVTMRLGRAGVGADARQVTLRAR